MWRPDYPWLGWHFQIEPSLSSPHGERSGALQGLLWVWRYPQCLRRKTTRGMEYLMHIDLCIHSCLHPLKIHRKNALPKKCILQLSMQWLWSCTLILDALKRSSTVSLQHIGSSSKHAVLLSEEVPFSVQKYATFVQSYRCFHQSIAYSKNQPTWTKKQETCNNKWKPQKQISQIQKHKSKIKKRKKGNKEIQKA